MVQEDETGVESPQTDRPDPPSDGVKTGKFTIHPSLMVLVPLLLLILLAFILAIINL